MDELSMNIQYRSTLKIIYEMCLLFCQDCMCVPAETIKTRADTKGVVVAISYEDDQDRKKKTKLVMCC